MKTRIIVAVLIGIFLGTVIPIKEPLAQIQYLLAQGDIKKLKKQLISKIEQLEERVSKLEEGRK